MAPHYFLLSIFVIAGSVAIIAALLDSDWFFNAYNAQTVVKRIGRKPARWFYGLIGVGMIILAAYFYTQLQ